MNGINKTWWLITKALLVTLAFAITACGTGADEQAYLDKAAGYLEKSDLNAASIELKNVLQKNANNAEARYLLGQIYLRLGDVRSAEKELRRALKAGWDEAAVQLLLAETLYRQGDFQQVLDDIPVKDSYPDAVKADLLGLWAASEAGLGKWDEAEQTVRSGEAITGDALWLLQTRIRLEINSNDLKAADRTLEHALKVHPDSQDLWLLRAGLIDNRGDDSGADMALQKVVDLDPPRNITAWGRQARLVQCKIRMRQKDFEKAADALNPVLDTYPDDPEANFLGGLMAFMLADYDLAEERLLNVFSVAPEHYASLLLFGNLKYEQGDYQQAAYYLEKAASSRSDDVSTQTLLGKTYLRLGQYEEAGKRLESAASMSADNAKLLALLGVARFEEGDTKAAILELEKAAAAAPADTGIRSTLAKAYMDVGDAGRAISELESMLEGSDENQQVESQLLLVYLRAGEFDKALTLASKLAERLPDNPLPHNLAGIAHEGKKDYVSAKGSYDAALRLQAGNSMALLSLARIDLIEGNAESARKRYQSILEEQPDYAPALVALAKLSARERKGTAEETLELLERARKADQQSLEPRLILSNYYLYKGMADEALVYANEALKIAPQDPLAMLAVGRAQFSAGDVASVNTLQKLTVRLPESAEAHYFLAEARARFDDIPGTRQSLQRVLEIKPDHEPAMRALGKLELSEGNMDAALKISQRLITSLPESAAGYLLKGDVLAAKGNNDDALSAYQSALVHAKGNAEAAIKTSRLQRALGNTKGSYQTMQNWLEKHPEDVAVRYALAMSYLGDGRNNDAISQYEQILEKQPDAPLALNDLAWLYHETGKPGALELAEKAYRLAPDNPAIQDTYGWILVQTGKIEFGLIPLEQAASNAPDNPDIRYHLAAALAKAGDRDRAKQELSSILQSDRQFSERDAALALQKELE